MVIEAARNQSSWQWRNRVTWAWRVASAVIPGSIDTIASSGKDFDLGTVALGPGWSLETLARQVSGKETTLDQCCRNFSFFSSTFHEFPPSSSKLFFLFFFFQIERISQRTGASSSTQESINLSPSHGQTERFLERFEGRVQSGGLQGIEKLDRYISGLLGGRQRRVDDIPWN